MIWIILFTLALGFIAGYRYGKGGRPFGSISGRKFDSGEDTNKPGTPWRRAQDVRSVDPVCHKPVSPEHAKPSVHQETVYYFCSRECREVFEANPDSYAPMVSAHGSGPTSSS